jgi:integrase/recombinase XerD
MSISHSKVVPLKVTPDHLREFLEYINTLGMSAHSQARILSGLKGFFKYLFFEN